MNKNNHRVSDARPEFIVLGFLCAESTHGYDLYRRFERHLGHLWHISQSQLYATLKRLESHALITGTNVSDSGGLERRRFSVSAEGRLRFDSWLADPSLSGPRFIKLEFISRLFFAEFLCTQDPLTLITAQRVAINEEVRRLDSRNENVLQENLVNRLGVSFRSRQLRSILDWLAEDVLPEFSANR